MVVECVFARVKREFPVLGRGKFSWERGHTDRGPMNGRFAKLVYVAGGLYNETCRRRDKRWPNKSREDARHWFDSWNAALDGAKLVVPHDGIPGEAGNVAVLGVHAVVDDESKNSKG